MGLLKCGSDNCVGENFDATDDCCYDPTSTTTQLQPFSAHTSSSYNADTGPEKCIDGITDTDAEMCHSRLETAPWVALDFGYGSKVSVEKVVLYNRGNYNAGRTRNVEVWLSESLPTSGATLFTGGVLLGTYPGPAQVGNF